MNKIFEAFSSKKFKVSSTIMAVILSVLQLFIPQLKDTPTDTTDFVPVLRFVAASDVHMKDEKTCREYERLGKLFDSSYKYADTQEYSNIDAFVFAGDSINTGTQQQWTNFMEVVNDHKRDTSELIVTYANSHDCSGDGTLARCESNTGVPRNYSTTINGFHFITVSQSEMRTLIDSAPWLAKELKKASNEDSEKPIFVFQHYHVTGTVYGSLNWGSPELLPVLAQYPQIIDFSGHSHYPINDPRSAYQKSFTAFGTGTLSYFELEKGMTYGTVPPKSENAAQFYIVEVAADNRVRVLPYNLLTDSFFTNPSSYNNEQLVYRVDKPSDKSTFTYTNARYLKADKPIFPENAKTEFSDITESSATVTFTQALDGEEIHDYLITVTEKKNKLKIKKYKIWSEFYFEPMSGTLSYQLDGLKKGTDYTVKITGYDTYMKKTATVLKGEFSTAQ